MQLLCLLLAFAITVHGVLGFSMKCKQKTEGDSASVSQQIILQDCLLNCPVTSEFNPVCGTDKVTYDNPGRLKCAQSCGINVSQMRASRCPDEKIPPVA